MLLARSFPATEVIAAHVLIVAATAVEHDRIVLDARARLGDLPVGMPGVWRRRCSASEWTSLRADSRNCHPVPQPRTSASYTSANRARRPA